MRHTTHIGTIIPPSHPDLNGSHKHKQNSPHIDGCRVGQAKHHLRRSVKARLNIRIHLTDNRKKKKAAVREDGGQGKAKGGGGSVILMKTHAIPIDWPTMTSHRNDKSGGSHMPGSRRPRLPFTRVMPPAITVITRAWLQMPNRFVVCCYDSSNRAARYLFYEIQKNKIRIVKPIVPFCSSGRSCRSR